jgi:glycosyltransferase involved in cell wall biosynthesis
MNVLLCCENYPPSVGGVQEVMRQIAERLVERGHAVTVYTGAHPSRPRSAELRGVRVESFAASGNLVRGLSGEVDRYRDAVLNGRHDVVLVKAAQQWSFDALAPVLDRIASRKVFIPCGFSGLFDAAYNSYYAEMSRWLASFDALIFYSGTYRDIEFARQLGITRLHVLPNGVDEREFGPEQNCRFRAQLGLDPNSLLLLSVGTLVPAKGHWEVLRAFDLARLPPHATLLLNGNDPQGGLASALRAIARAGSGYPPLRWLAYDVNRRHRGAKRVVIADLPRTNVVAAFRAADVFVFASQIEYSPLVLFEAAAAGTPFLTSPVGNAREIAEWTSAGIVYEALTDESGRARVDSRALARELERCVAARERLSEMGRAGRRRVFDAGFTWDAIVPRYEAILRGDAAVQDHRNEAR